MYAVALSWQLAILDFEITYYLDLSFNFYIIFCDAIAINMVIYIVKQIPIPVKVS